MKTTEIPFGRIVHEIDSRAGEKSEDLVLMSVSISRGLIPRSELTDKEPRADDLSIYKRCWQGDVVLNRMSAYQGALGLAHMDGMVSPDYAVLRPNVGLDARFLTYLMKSNWFISEMTSRLRGIGSPGATSVRTPRVNIDDLRNIPIALPLVEEQGRIADFLDDQVTRIDQASEGYKRQQRICTERQLQAIAEQIPTIGDQVPMSALSTIIDTEHKTAPGIDGGGYWVVGTPAIRNGVIDFERAYETDLNGYLEWTRRGIPSPGDILLTREAPVGEVARVQVDDPPLAIGQRVVLIKPRPSMDSSYLMAILMSPILQRTISDANQGSLHPHLNMSNISRLRIPKAPLPIQVRVGEQVQVAIRHNQQLQSHFGNMEVKLEERKRAVITAAVTGQFDVATARPFGFGQVLDVKDRASASTNVETATAREKR